MLVKALTTYPQRKVPVEEVNEQGLIGTVMAEYGKAPENLTCLAPSTLPPTNKLLKVLAKAKRVVDEQDVPINHVSQYLVQL